MTPIRVAIVDDALFIRAALTRLLEDSPDLTVVGAAATGEELLEHLDAWRPDVVTLDLNMPGMGGLLTLDRLMAVARASVIILSTHSGEGAPLTLEALSRGAADFIDKEAYSLVDFQTLRSVLREKILHVTRDRLPLRDAATMPPAAGWMDPATHDAVVIGASTGGPRAIETVLTGLGRGFDLPIVMAQHMPEGFTRAFAQRLDRLVGLRVREAEPDALLTRGTAWLAPAGRHLAIAPGAAGPVLQVVQPQPHALYQPSVDVLFASAAAVFSARVIAVLLTGMGDDGAAGMETLFRAGAHTIAQDEASSVVFGMPRAAIARGAARDVLALDQIAPRLELLAGAPSAPALGAGVTP